MQPFDENFELIKASKEGDHNALNKLVQIYSEPVHSFIFSVLHDPRIVEDLAQETFLRMINALPSYEFRAPFKSWLFRIAVNLCRDHLRRRKIRRIVSLFQDYEVEGELNWKDTALDPEQTLEKKERLERIHQALKQLPEQLRMVFILRDVQDMTYEEIAEALQWQLGTVKSRLFRARNELAKKLNPHWEDV